MKDSFISLTFLHFVVEIKATQTLCFFYSGKFRLVKKYLFKEYINNKYKRLELKFEIWKLMNNWYYLIAF